MTAHCYRKLATEMFASEFQFVSPRDAPLIRRNFAELDFSVCEEFAFSVERAPITVDIDVHPLLLRHKHEVDTKRRRGQIQDQLPWCARAVNSLQEETLAVAVSLEVPGCIPRPSGRWDSNEQQNGDA